jgi:hypothetical protein
MNDLDEFKKNAAFLEDLENEDNSELNGDSETGKITGRKENRSKDRLTQGQKFLLALMVFIFILVAGFFLMLVSGKMVLPIY